MKILIILLIGLRNTDGKFNIKIVYYQLLVTEIKKWICFSKCMQIVKSAAIYCSVYVLNCWELIRGMYFLLQPHPDWPCKPHTHQPNGNKLPTTPIYCQDLEMHGIYPSLTLYGFACMHTNSFAIYMWWWSGIQ
jgi:hypothetical protein